MSRSGDTDRTETGEVEGHRPVVGAALLHVVHPPDRRGTLRLPGGIVVVGRSASRANAVIDHPTLSRGHIEIEWSGASGPRRVRDLGSRNGTTIDGRPVGATRVDLPVGNVVLRLGDVLLVLEPAIEGALPDTDVSRRAVPGGSVAAQRLRAAIARAAPDRAPVLVLGETGTGKEWIAREVHRLSGRAGPMLPVNCAAIGAAIAESQLFGHVRGAFTGASEDRPGVFREAAGGTVFLDEIGDLPPALQPKLLRLIQEGEVQPVGAARAQRVDVRIIAATNRDLVADVAGGRFRRDLYARIALWEIRVPSLRDRRADVLELFDLLADARAATLACPRGAGSLSAGAAERLLLGEWAENLRGLDRLLHDLAGAVTPPIEARDLPPWIDVVPRTGGAAGAGETGPAAPPTAEELADFLRAAGGSVRAAARHFARDRRQIYRWIRAYGLESVAGREPPDGESQ